MALLVVARRGEQHREPWTGPREPATDLEAVVAAQTDVQEHRLGGEALHGIQGGRGTAGLCHDRVAAPLQQLARGVPERGLVVHDQHSRSVGRGPIS